MAEDSRENQQQRGQQAVRDAHLRLARAEQGSGEDQRLADRQQE